ncbi:MAG: DUF3592 domain-containing protein [Magnetospiraceae bacterium]
MPRPTEIAVRPVVESLLFAAFGLALILVAGSVSSAEQIRTRDWRLVTGVVEAADVIPLRGTLDGSLGRFRLNLVYRYVVEGRAYSSVRVLVLPSGLDAQKAHQFQSVVPRIGSLITLRYDPASPFHAKVDNAQSLTRSFLLLIGILVFFLGVGLAVLVSRRQIDRSPHSSVNAR